MTYLKTGAAALLLSFGATMTLADTKSDLRPQSRPDGLQATALRLATSDAGFEKWLADFRSRAITQGIAKRTLDAAFAGARYEAGIIRLDRNQSEFSKQIWDYLDTAVSDSRIAGGRAALKRQGRTLRLIEQKYGVDKEIVAAIWGLESAFGAVRGDTPLIGALATLAYDGRRGAFFEEELMAALRIVQSGDVAPGAMTGSWAGAMGHTQFMPSSYLAHAVDFTGDGRRDIWSDDPADALASTAAYLAHFGWTKDQPWGVEIRLPEGFDPVRARRTLPQTPSAWAAEGIRDTRGQTVPDHGPASILLPGGAGGPAFMIFDNFEVLERYNKADAYVIGVGHLSDRLKGRPAIEAPWPRQHRAISATERRELQRRLQNRGFAVEKIDGIIGPNTIDAIREFQKSAGMSADGFPTEDLLDALGG
ncbi:membrane-bound lytic murein transglycosylase B [Roseovarius nanhaiticus]|uniref:Membrane-bound lytic murein transglycosylase B n=2 Tax=Roseovarius nanhaiticus TaxID=573024 RepID=A0A1N7H2S3_9RHOB|nr:lytic murein transglycosylase [Roseovarius nanhaiticus]SEL15201.1 membrane-bound lytic murein transglycosylase B [Roseovarius nanhaiticus]SIS19103.1 membrane-bound lytic murein transglycosylase B [Roseovarius nanhaiticus]